MFAETTIAITSSGPPCRRRLHVRSPTMFVAGMRAFSPVNCAFKTRALTQALFRYWEFLVLASHRLMYTLGKANACRKIMSIEKFTLFPSFHILMCRSGPRHYITIFSRSFFGNCQARVMGPPLVSLASPELGLLGLSLEKGASQRPLSQSSDYKFPIPNSKIIQDEFLAKLPM